MTLAWTTQNVYRNALVFVVVGTALAVLLAVVGLPPVSIHGPQHFVGVMDPLCGMTRAVRALARGELGVAWAYNPASFVLGLAAVGVVVASVVGWVVGRWPTIRLVRPDLARAVALVLVAVLWVNQQSHAARLA